MGRKTIGVVAKAAGVNVETIRYYQRKGLIETPNAVATAFREYPDGTADRIRFIKRAQEIGFTLAEITDLLRLCDGVTGTRADVKRLAEMKLESIRQKLVDLRNMEMILHDLVSQCSGQGSVRGCPIIESLTDQEVTVERESEKK